jgi:MFS transporter, DHA1 family, multidrug resistance protein
MKPEMREYLLMIIGGTVTMFSGGLVGPIFAPFVRREFTAPIFLVGLAVSGYFVVRMLTEFPIGSMSDKVGPRWPLIVGRLFGIVGAAICWQTKDIWTLIFARAIWGVGDASFFCIGMTYVSNLFPAGKRGRALGVFQAVELTGSFIGQTAGGFLADQFGLRFNFFLSILLGFVAFGVVLLLKGYGTSGKFQGIKSLLPDIPAMRSLLSGTLLIVCIINLLCMMMNMGVMGTLMPLYATEVLGFGLSGYAFLVSGMTVGNVTGNLLGGLLSDRFGRKRVLAGGFILGIFSLIGISAVTDYFLLLAFMLVNGLFWGIIYGVTPAFVADSAPPEKRGSAIGLYRTFFDLGGVVGPVAYSAVIPLFAGSLGYTVAFYLAAISVAVNLLLLRMLKENK